MKAMIFSIPLLGLLSVNVHADLDFHPLPFMTTGSYWNVNPSSTGYAEMLEGLNQSPTNTLILQSPTVDWKTVLKDLDKGMVMFTPKEWKPAPSLEVWLTGRCTDPVITLGGGTPVFVNPCSSEGDQK